MKKTFVLDPNVLVHDPDAILHFQDNNIVIPIKAVQPVILVSKDTSARMKAETLCACGTCG